MIGAQPLAAQKRNSVASHTRLAKSARVLFKTPICVNFLCTENPRRLVEVRKRKCIMVNTNNKGGEEIPQGELRFNTRNVLGV
jgi:hypothetical protein